MATMSKKMQEIAIALCADYFVRTMMRQRTLAPTDPDFRKKYAKKFLMPTLKMHGITEKEAEEFMQFLVPRITTVPIPKKPE